MELRLYLRVLLEKWWIVLPIFLVTLGVTIWLTFSQTAEYEATATYILRPNLQTDDDKSFLSGLDVLSRRAEIASTYAEVADSRLIKEQAAQEIGLSSAEKKGISVRSQLVAGTNVLEFTATANDAELAQQFANAVGNQTVNYVQQLYEPYQLAPLDQAARPRSPVRPNRPLNLAMGAALGLILGAGLALVAHYLELPFASATSYRVADKAAGRDPYREGRAGEESTGVAEEPGTDRSTSRLEGHTAMRRRAAWLEYPSASATSDGVAGEAVGRDPVREGEAGEESTGVAEEPVRGPSIRQPGGPSARRNKVGWVVAAVLTLLLVVAVSALWFSGRGASAVSLPSDSVTALEVPTAVWTSTVASPTDTPPPTAIPTESSTATVEPTPTVCVPPVGWMVYVVGRDDTLSSLALKYGISEAEISEANCLTSGQFSALQTLILPPLPGSPTPTVSATASQTPTYTPSPTLEATSPTPEPASPTPEPASPTPEATELVPAPSEPATGSMLFQAVTLQDPPDKQDFQTDSEIVLLWEPAGELPEAAYYVITVAYSHLGDTWYDEVPWTRDTSWNLSEHSYLLDLSDDGRFEWAVQVMQQTGEDAQGRPTGSPLSPPSEIQILFWRRPFSGGGGQAPEVTPTVPDP